MASRRSSKEIAGMPRRRLVIAVGLFVAVSAFGGGLALIAWRHGNPNMPLALVANTPFASLLWPGVLLAGVVGGSSLTCALLAWRRARAAIDATLVAGGALSVWILAEAAMLREVHWLHGLYGTLGVGLLGLGVAAAWRGRTPRHRWLIAVTLAETTGFMAPAMAGLLTSRAGLPEAQQAVVVAAAGFVEGLALGAGQAWAFPLPVRRLRYALLTGLGAGAVWATVMAMMGLASSGRSIPLALALAAALVGLLAIGASQWIELRRHARGARRWIGWTALAWTLALPLSFAPGPFVDETTPLGAHVALWACGGLLMAYVMALVTWQGARRLSRGAV